MKGEKCDMNETFPKNFVWATDPEEEPINQHDIVTTTAQQAFGIKYLYPWQRLVIANILDAVSAQENLENLEKQFEEGLISKEELDSMIYDQDGANRGKQIVLLPTGAGKSMCFLVPAILLNGPTLILYPLLALMSDQERRMNEGGISSVVFRGGQTIEQRKENFKKIEEGAKVILANPEVLQDENLMKNLKKVGIKHIAIDESHCVSEWGDTFRPAYVTLGKIIKALGNPVVTAFTATASPTVLQRVSEILFDGRAHIVRSESDRPNIIYHVTKAEAKEKTVMELAIQHEKPMIIFCSSRKRTEKLSATLSEIFGYDKVKFYHAGLEKEEKTKIEKWFFPKSDAILCATCAFGMGIDKKDIKTVIHLDPPPTAESYIQEAGRGGRDGSIANAILVWSSQDLKNAMKFDENSRERVLSTFAETKECRRQVLLDALGGEQAVCSGCDNCNGSSVHLAMDEKNALKILKRNQRYLDYDQAANLIKEKFNEKYEEKGLIRFWEIADSQMILDNMLKSGKIKVCKFPWKGKISVVKKP